MVSTPLKSIKRCQLIKSNPFIWCSPSPSYHLSQLITGYDPIQSKTILKQNSILSKSINTSDSPNYYFQLILYILQSINTHLFLFISIFQALYCIGFLLVFSEVVGFFFFSHGCWSYSKIGQEILRWRWRGLLLMVQFWSWDAERGEDRSCKAGSAERGLGTS